MVAAIDEAFVDDSGRPLQVLGGGDSFAHQRTFTLPLLGSTRGIDRFKLPSMLTLLTATSSLCTMDANCSQTPDSMP